MNENPSQPDPADDSTRFTVWQPKAANIEKNDNVWLSSPLIPEHIAELKREQKVKPLAWQREILGHWTSTTKKQRELENLAEEYWNRTEAYDEKICTVRGSDGHRYLSPEDWRLSGKHAVEVECELRTKAVGMGFTHYQWNQARREAAMRLGIK